jgi:hypothetical protein
MRQSSQPIAEGDDLQGLFLYFVRGVAMTLDISPVSGARPVDRSPGSRPGVSPLANSSASRPSSPPPVTHDPESDQRSAQGTINWDRVFVIGALALIGILIVLEIVQLAASK